MVQSLIEHNCTDTSLYYIEQRDWNIEIHTIGGTTVLFLQVLWQL